MELEIIVNLSVQHRPHAAVFVRERLMTTRYVNDAEPPESKADTRSDKNALVIRPTMNDRLRHATNDVARDFVMLIEFKKSANPAHIFSFLVTGYLDSATCREAQIQLRVVVEHSVETKALDDSLARRGSIFLPQIFSRR